MMILKEFSRIVCVSLFSYQGSLLVCLSDSLFTLPHLIDCVKYFFEVFYFSKFKTSNGEGGIWTLAPLLTTCTLSRGVPSAILGTSPCADSHLPIWQSHDCIWRIPSTAMLRKTICWNLTERVGFEPTRPFGQTVFKTASLWPLRYLSGSFGSSFELAALHQRKMYSIRALQECQHSFSFFLLFL